MSGKINFGSLTIDIDSYPDSVRYSFKGDVDDTFRQQDVPRVKSSSIIMDLEGLTNFNSCGVREWVFLIKDLEKLGAITFTKCSIPMVDQFNMVPESIGSGNVESFYAPYVCETHGDTEVLLDTKGDQDAVTRQMAPEKKCPACSQNLIFDAMPDSYFLFLLPAPNKVSKAS